MKFFCDHMLNRLGKWLRAAGYDTLIAEGTADDRLIYDEAYEDGRLLITRDKHFLDWDKEEKVVIHLKGNLLKECAAELNHRMPIDWLYAVGLNPFHDTQFNAKEQQRGAKAQRM